MPNLSNLIDKVVPPRLRHLVGIFIFYYIIRRSRFLLYPYLYLLTGKIPKGIKFLPNQQCSAYGILTTWEGIWTFMEIFQDEIYEKMGSPKEGDIVIDVGAYVGMFTVKTSRQVRKKGLVIAIEPEPINFSYLAKNCGGFKNVRLVKKAVSSREGQAKLYVSKGSALHPLTQLGNKYIEVETTTVDRRVAEYKLPRVDFIKIDAEGAELEILKGSTQTLSNNNLKLAIAAYHSLPNGKHEMPMLIAFLETSGFKVCAKNGYVYAEKELGD